MFVYGYICYCTIEFVPEHVRVRVHLHVCEHVHDYLCVVQIYNKIYICYIKFMFTIYIYDYLHVYVHCTMYNVHSIEYALEHVHWLTTILSFIRKTKLVE